MCALSFLTIEQILEGYVDPHFSLILRPSGLIPIENTENEETKIYINEPICIQML